MPVQDTSKLPRFTNIVGAVDRFVELSQIAAAYKAVEPEYELLKAFFREIAKGRDIQFPSSAGSAAVAVEQKPDAVCRVVEPEDLTSVVKWSGEHVFDLFTLHPTRGSERNFEHHALKLRPKRDARALYARLLRATTPFVRLIGLRK